MEYSILGKTGLKVSRLALGAARHGEAFISEAEVERVLNHSLDLGINLIDTAANYKKSEERIGRYLIRRKDEFTIATKCGSYWDDEGGIVADYSPAGIVRTVERSRSRLRLDVIDLVQFHGLPPPDKLEAAFETLLGLKEKGYAKFVGVSADGPKAAAFAGKPTPDLDATAIARDWPVDTWQFTYNFLSPEAAGELMPVLVEENIGTIVKRPISNVVWDIAEEPEDDFYRKPWERARALPLETLAEGLPLVEFALRYTLSHQDVNTILSGTISGKHLKENCRYAAKGPLPEEMVRRVGNVFAEKFGKG